MAYPRVLQKPAPDDLAPYMPILNEEKLRNANSDLKACADVYSTLLATARFELEQLQSALEKSLSPSERNKLEGRITELKKIILPMHQTLMPLLQHH